MSLRSPVVGAIRGWALGTSGSAPELPDPSQPWQPSPEHWDPLGLGEPRVPAPQLRPCQPCPQPQARAVLAGAALQREIAQILLHTG